MASWRDGATQQAQDDLDRLVDAALPFAEQMLDKSGEFFPYAVALNEAGEARMVAADPGGGERPASLDVLATLVEGLREQRSELRAVALVSDVRLSDSDAVRVELEHRDGHAMAVFRPYKQKRMRAGIAILRPDRGSKRSPAVGIAADIDTSSGHRGHCVPMRLRLMVDYDCWPLWNDGEPEEGSHNVDPRDLRLSVELRGRLDAWQRSYDAQLNRDVPQDSRWRKAIYIKNLLKQKDYYLLLFTCYQVLL